MFRVLIFIFFLVFFSSLSNASTIEQCKTLHQAKERLACYDNYHHYSESIVDSDFGKIEKENRSNQQVLVPSEEVAPLKRNDFSLLAHRQSYFMPVSYTKTRRPLSDIAGSTLDDSPSLDDIEVKFQISFKMNLWNNILGENSQLMAGYTQKSFWQMYNSDFSSLFRETNYEPEIFINKQMEFDILGFKLSNASLGFVHQSNGRSSLFSRSWNRVYANFIFHRDNFALSIKPWQRINESIEDDDNPDLEDYLGKYEVGMLYKWNKSEFTVLFRNLAARKHSTSYQLGWQFPINKDINFYAEYFNGYGESLIDYDHRNETFGLGITVGRWVK
jgi:phospholipase A1